MKSRNKFLLFLLTVIMLGCKGKIKKIEKESFAFGTYFKISIFTDDKTKGEKQITEVFDEIKRIDREYNSKREGSLIHKLNNSKKEIFTEEGIFILKEIQKAYELSLEKYDITIEPLMKIWGFSEIDTKKDKIPSESEIAEAISNVDFSKVKINGNEVLITDANIKIDTGSFLKGYAIKKASDKLKKLNNEKALISSGSSIMAIGRKLEDKPWRIGIQNPDDTSKILGVIELENESMGVSGDYQTYVEINGKKYHHILDKKTGYPIDDKKMVVVVAKDAFKADIYSTVYFLLPIEEIKKTISEINEFGLLVVDKNGEIYTTKNLKFKKGK